MQSTQPTWKINGRTPLIWVIDDLNTALAAACRAGASLFDCGQGLERLGRLVEDLEASLSVNFIMAPEFGLAGLPVLADLEAGMHEPAMAAAARAALRGDRSRLEPPHGFIQLCRRDQPRRS